jgi:hypothetical protein
VTRCYFKAINKSEQFGNIYEATMSVNVVNVPLRGLGLGGFQAWYYASGASVAGLASGIQYTGTWKDKDGKLLRSYTYDSGAQSSWWASSVLEVGFK